jgi:hypothetical protein
MKNSHGVAMFSPNKWNSLPFMYCIQATPPIAMTRAPMEPMNGHGLGSMM